MICPNCQTNNPEEARFCSNCGTSLRVICPNCSAESPLGAKFCGACGEQLIAAEAPLSPGQQKLLQYVPKELLAKLEAARSRHEMLGERRVVTMLFCDVKGSTAAAEQMDPEDWAEVMNGAFQYLIEPVYRYEGTLARLMGDAVLGFFGAPIAHEDDPERAVLAGLGIVQGIAPYREQVREQWDLDFNVRVGVNTGLVVVGEVGSDLRVEYTAMGDAVNLAARMEQTAEPGTVQIADETHRRVAPLFEFEALGGIQVKGKTEPVNAYRVIGRPSDVGRTRGIQGIDAPLVGRQAEMDRLHQVLEAMRRGSGGIVTLIGEAGLGKSRLIAEFHQLWQSEIQGGYWAESRGVSYETNRPYGQFQQQLQQLLKVTETDHSAQIQQKIDRALSWLPTDAQTNSRQALAAMLGLQSAENGSGLEGEALKQELFRTSLSLLERQLETGAVVLVFEDLHWADPASVELLMHLFQLTDSGPILFLCAFRADRASASWQVKLRAETDYPHRYTELTLNPLSAGSSQELVEQLLAMPELPPKLSDLIQQKSEGNPFFVEELVRAMIDNGIVQRQADQSQWRVIADFDQITIPDNLQSLLVARIDRLQEQERHTLQLASVIGRTFYYRVLQAISEVDESLDRDLSALQRVELIREAARDPELEYAFRHALTQEAVYRSILRKERRQFHLRVAEALLQLFADRERELAPLLAQHLAEAGDPRAAHYLSIAGDEAFRVYAIDQAIRDYRRALEFGVLDDPELLRHTYQRLGRCYELIDDYQAAMELYGEMRTLAQQRDDGEMELIALTESAKLYSTPSPLRDEEKGRTLSQQAVELARSLGNHEAEARILWNQSNNETFGGDMRRALDYADQSLEVAQHYGLTEQMAFTMSDMARPLLMTGRLERAQEMLEESAALWRQLDNLPMLVDNLGSATMLGFWSGRYDEAIIYGSESYRIAKSINNLWGMVGTRVWQGVCYFEQGRFGPAIEILAECLQGSQQIGVDLGVMFGGSHLALAYGSLGALDRAFGALEQVQAFGTGKFGHLRGIVLATQARLELWSGQLAQARATIEPAYANLKPEGSINVPDHVLLADGEIALAGADPDRTLDRVAEMLKYAELARRRPAVPEALLLKARALIAKDQIAAAKQSLLQARQAAEAMGAQFPLWRIVLELGRIEAASGAADQADALLAQARTIVQQIAQEIPEPALRASFEQLPQVQEASLS